MKKADFQNKKKRCNVRECVHVRCVCAVQSHMPGKPFIKVLMVVGFKVTFTLFLFCSITLIFCMSICCFTIKNKQYCCTNLKEREGREGGKEGRKEEGKKTASFGG